LTSRKHSWRFRKLLICVCAAEVLLPPTDEVDNLRLRFTEQQREERRMAVKAIQLGQVWKQDSTSKNFLVTKLYNEVFSQFAMLRPADATAATTDTVRVKVTKSADGATLPGYTFTQDSGEEF